MVINSLCLVYHIRSTLDILFVFNISFPLKVQIGNNSYNGIYKFIELKWIQFLCVWGWASHFLEKNSQSTIHPGCAIKIASVFRAVGPPIGFCKCLLLLFF